METTMEIKRLIGSRIKQVRKAKGFSQEELAEMAEVSSKYLSSIERGNENPTLDTFIKLAQALDVEFFELFHYAQEKSLNDAKRLLIDMIKKSDREKLDLASKVIKAIYL
jgi:transcriptional regulator with XRE-family HTH domain